MRVLSLNLNGIRSAYRKGLPHWLATQNADLVCVQEIRAQEHQLDPEMLAPAGLHAVYLPAQRPGYSGVGIWSRHPPDRFRVYPEWPEAHLEGRLLGADFGRLTVISLYVPSGSSQDSRQAFKYRFLARLREWLDARRRSRRHVLVCGDWNIAHRPIDLKNWRANRKNSGFLPEERAWMDELLAPGGWHDVHRELQPEATGSAYTWWSNRGRAWENNVGWRIDYQMATPGLARLARAASVYRGRRFSDHAPLLVDYDYGLS